MKRRRIVGEFSEALIKSYLSSKAYERRGWTRERYIEECKAVWKKTRYDPEYEKKIIVDFSEPVTVSQLFGVDSFVVDFVDSALSQQTVHGFENKKDIECLKLSSGKLPHADGKVDRVKIDEAFQPATLPIEKGTLEQQHYFVALFDVLGFSNLVKEKGSKAILRSYQKLIKLAILNKSYTAFGRVKIGSNQYLMGGTYSPINYTYFSDTILLWTTAYNTHVSPFLAKCSDLICEALKIQMPLRGSVCFGEAVMNKSTNTFIGQAIVEANDIEKNQKWIGATLGSAFALSELKEALSEALVVPLYCEHFKPEMKLTYPYLTLDWVTRWKERNNPDLLSVLAGLKEKAPEINKVYYDNTMAFVQYASLDDCQARGVFLRAKGYRVKDVGTIDVHHLHMQLLILKVMNEPPHAGVIFTFPEPILQTSKQLRDLVAKSFLFIKRIDKNRLIEYFSDLGEKELNLGEAGFIYQVEKRHVEYLDIFRRTESA